MSNPLDVLVEHHQGMSECELNISITAIVRTILDLDPHYAGNIDMAVLELSE